MEHFYNAIGYPDEQPDARSRDAEKVKFTKYNGSHQPIDIHGKAAAEGVV